MEWEFEPRHSELAHVQGISNYLVKNQLLRFPSAVAQYFSKIQQKCRSNVKLF